MGGQIYLYKTGEKRRTWEPGIFEGGENTKDIWNVPPKGIIKRHILKGLYRMGVFESRAREVNGPKNQKRETKTL